MCGYDPFYWYEKQLDEEYEARQHGYDVVDEYKQSLIDDAENRAYDNWKDNQLTGEA